MSSNRNDTSRTVAKNPEESARAPNEWNKYYQELQRTGIFLLTDISTTGETINRLLTGTVTKILFENYKQRDTRGPLTKIYSLLKMPNLSKEDHWPWRFRYLQPRRKLGWYDWQKYTAIGRSRGASGRDRGSGRNRISGRRRGSYVVREKYASPRK